MKYRCLQFKDVIDFFNERIKNKYSGEIFYNKYYSVINNKKKYDKVIEKVMRGESLGLPRRKELIKVGSQKKRYVYTFDKATMLFLTVLTDDLANEYDNLFSNNLFSYRKSLDIMSVVKYLNKFRDKNKFAYKIDIHAYFNSIPVDRILNDIKPMVCDEIFNMLSRTFKEDYVIVHREKIKDNNKGILPGTPLSGFLANYYIRELDEYFEKNNIKYARYSDDIIVFADDLQALENHKKHIIDFLKDKGLEINPKKEKIYYDYKFDFLGLHYDKSIIDISPEQFKSIKMKIRRKARTIVRRGNWNDKTNEDNLKRFITYINYKMNGLQVEGEEKSPSWKSWYGRTVNTRKTIKELNKYILDTAKYVFTQKRNKGRFKIKDSQIKQLGIELM